MVALNSHGFPKSNAGASTGDFCFVPITDARFALFVYLFPQLKSRSYFFGALTSQILGAPRVELVSPKVVLGEWALLHIKCFQKNDTPLAGNIFDRLDPAAVDAMRTKAHSYRVGTVHRVWGHSTIIQRANTIATQPTVRTDGAGRLR